MWMAPPTRHSLLPQPGNDLWLISYLANLVRDGREAHPECNGGGIPQTVELIETAG